MGGTGKRLKLQEQSFGRLKVVEYSGIDKFHRTMWKCKCSCGKEKIIPGTNLIHGTKSCGCISREVPTWTTEVNGSANRKPNGISALNDLYSSYRYKSKKYDIEFSLTIDEFIYLTSGCCFYCGDPPQKLHGRNDLNGGYVFNGIDRLDPNIGYNIKNCVPCCSPCNYAKHRQSVESFLSMVKKIYIHRLEGKNE